MLVKADQLARNLIALEQHPRAPRVLASDRVGLAQGLERAQGDVPEVADRRGTHHESPWAVPHHAWRIGGSAGPGE